MEAIKKEVYQTIRKFRKNVIQFSEYREEIKSISEKYDMNLHSIVYEINKGLEESSKRLRSYKESDRFRFRIRKYCNYHGYSDIDPCEVIEVISPRKVIVRQMDAVLVEAPKTFYKGGFLGHTENDEQRWKCESNENNQTIVLTLTKKGWGQGQYRMSDEPRKFYDYNF